MLVTYFEDGKPIWSELEFDEDTRQRLKSRFIEEFKKKHPKAFIREIEFEANVFVKILESHGNAIPELQKHTPPKQQRRKEQILSMAKALDRLVDQFKELDSAARGFAVWRGFEEVARTLKEENPLKPGMYAVEDVHEFKDDLITELSAFSLGLHNAAKELPEYDFNIPLRVAIWIEHRFFENRLDYTTSETGFAAECLRAVFNLGGLQIDRVGYWLASARKHSDSMISWINDQQKHNDK